MKLNFDNMSKAELRAYVMSHRDDQEAFCKLVDRLKADSINQTRHPFPKYARGCRKSARNNSRKDEKISIIFYAIQVNGIYIYHKGAEGTERRVSEV